MRQLVATALRKGFEAALKYDGYEVDTPVPRMKLTCSRFAKYVVVEALDRSDKSIGKSEVVATVPAVEQAGEDKSEAATPESKHEMSGDSDSWMAEVIAILTNPIATFVTGLISCAVACAVFCAAWRYGNLSWKLQEGFGYEPVERNDQGELEDNEGESAEKG
jgi:type IV secretory pathway VirB2 component (pilin)